MPGPDDDQLTWIQFALTFDWYAEKGTHEACAAFADAVRDRWEQAGTLPVGLNDLRAALFFEQRRWCWSNEGPFNDNEWRYWRSLVEAIRHELPYDDRLPPEPYGIQAPIVGPGEVAGVRTTRRRGDRRARRGDVGEDHRRRGNSRGKREETDTQPLLTTGHSRRHAIRLVAAHQ